MDLISSVAKSIGGLATKAKDAVKDLLSPPRTKYDPAKIPLILQTGESAPFDQTYVRVPIEFTNKRGQTLVGSLYTLDTDLDKHYDTCLIYLHGVSSSQLEGQFLVPNFCFRHISVFCFDFAGCGCSNGHCLSLGYFEHQDTETAIEKLSNEYGFTKFALWGRSMGAATALLVKSPLVKCSVIDSAYTSVEDMMVAIAASYHIPSSAFIGALKLYIASIFEEPFNIEDISPLNAVSKCDFYPVPCAFGHAKDDDFVPFEQGKKLYDSMKNNDKLFKQLPGGHNSRRDYKWIQYGVAFILNHFGYSVDPDELDVCECRSLQEGTEQFASFSSMVANQKETRVENPIAVTLKEPVKQEKKKETEKVEIQNDDKKIDETKKKKKHSKKKKTEKEPVEKEGDPTNSEEKPKTEKKKRTRKPKSSNEQNSGTTEENKSESKKPSKKKRHRRSDKTSTTPQEESQPKKEE